MTFLARLLAMFQAPPIDVIAPPDPPEWERELLRRRGLSDHHGREPRQRDQPRGYEGDRAGHVVIAQIRRVWPGEKRTTVIAIDAEDGCEKACYVWTDTPRGQLIASLCLRLENNGGGMSDQQIVLTVKPKQRHFGYEIEAAELLPTEARA